MFIFVYLYICMCVSLFYGLSMYTTPFLLTETRRVDHPTLPPHKQRTQEMARLREENADVTELWGHAKDEAEEAEAERDALGVELAEARRHLAGLCARAEGLQVRAWVGGGLCVGSDVVDS